METVPQRAAVTARLNLVREHVRCENAHDLDGIMRTFGDDGRYDDEPWGEHHAGLNGVRSYYVELLRSVPDLYIDVQREYSTNAAVILEVVIRGTHLGTWRGLPATGRRLAIPLCGIFTFDDRDRLARERIYYDRASVLKQLGVFHEPQSVAGQLFTVLAHPVTIAHAVIRKLRRKS
jgi:steroid delta-isomerase-like uncharacterized protein